MAKDKFLAQVHRGRDTMNYDEFVEFLDKSVSFPRMVEVILDKTTRWAESVGYGKKVERSKLSPEQERWRSYFADHSFDPEGAKNIADLVQLLTGVDCGAFISFSKASKKGSFGSFVAIVPVDNTNGHSYMIGRTIMTLKSGNVFYTDSGDSGNNMSPEHNTFKLATKEQIREYLASVLWRSSTLTSYLVDYLI